MISTRTEDEILEHVEHVKDLDFFAVRRCDLWSALPWQTARTRVPILSAIPRKEWEAPDSFIADDDVLVERIIDYIPFAVDKAENHRGLSANRSVDHFKAWVWLMGDDAWRAIPWENYPQYGAPILAAVADLVGYEWNRSEAFINMAAGKACRPGCVEGCGL